MKTILTALLFLCFCTTQAQTITTEEKNIRAAADFDNFLAGVKNNDKKGCLCNANELAVFSFKGSTGKTVSLCISNAVSTNSGYLVYRYGTTKQIELSYPQDTANSFSKFLYQTYHRGGGKQNAAMYLNWLSFTNGDYTYNLYDDWNAEDDHYSRGILVTNNKTNKSFAIDAKGKITGSLSAFDTGNVVALDPAGL